MAAEDTGGAERESDYRRISSGNLGNMELCGQGGAYR